SCHGPTVFVLEVFAYNGLLLGRSKASELYILMDILMNCKVKEFEYRKLMSVVALLEMYEEDFLPGLNWFELFI
ncbi:hypothetical protein Droror1_Dr00017633, partial [Drosera rotundifolia]